jgi:hypothetical protein
MIYLNIFMASKSVVMFFYDTALLFVDIYSVFTFPSCVLRQYLLVKYIFLVPFSLQDNFLILYSHFSDVGPPG